VAQVRPVLVRKVRVRPMVRGKQQTIDRQAQHHPRAVDKLPELVVRVRAEA
jgi:hypothetical protein